MERLITVNGKTFKAAEFTFNTICQLESMGLSLDNISSMPMSMIRGYIAISAKITAEQAGQEMEQHIINGGNFEDVGAVMSAQIEDSGFFQTLSQKTETVDEQPKKRATKKA